MNIDFEAALKYIDLGSYDKAIDKLKTAIENETEKNDLSTATQYRCVLGELYANLGRKDESKAEFEKVLDYCDETHTLQKQGNIAATYISAFEGKLPAQPQPAAKRPGDVPLVPKPVQNKAFIAKQSRKNHK
ncbi:MAG: hypothetical protein ACI4RK_03980 [Oscillospiraceae bacterium]